MAQQLCRNAGYKAATYINQPSLIRPEHGAAIMVFQTKKTACMQKGVINFPEKESRRAAYTCFGFIVCFRISSLIAPALPETNPRRQSRSR
jgi:hypothetical protein